MTAPRSRPVQVSLGLQTDKAPGEYARLARLAEELGFDGVSVFSDLLYQPPVAALLEMAAATERIRLGCACWNPYTLHPYEIASEEFPENFHERIPPTRSARRLGDFPRQSGRHRRIRVR